MFNGIWLVASEPLELQGREIATGERFEISRIHSGALLAQGRAMVAPKVPPAPVPPVPARRSRARKTTTIAITAESSDYPSENLVAPSRSYHRRDMEPEE